MEVSGYDYFTPALIDCWKFVLEHITEMEDVETLVLTCPLFAEMLHTRKISELVVPILLKKVALPRDILLSLRLLNKGTKRVVDSFLSNIVHDEHWLQEACNLPTDRPDLIERFRTVYSPQILSGSLVSKRLVIGAPEDGQVEPMIRFFHPIGHLIKILQLNLCFAHRRPQTYPDLFSLLEQLPVIASLSLNFNVWSPVYEEEGFFPSLPFLTELKLKSPISYPTNYDAHTNFFIELIIKVYGPQLEKFSCCICSKLSYDLSNLDLSKLECMEIGQCSGDEFSSLSNLPQLQLSNVRVLVLIGDCLTLKASFLAALNHLRNTLEELHLRAELDAKDFGMVHVDDPGLLERALPKLRKVVTDNRNAGSVIWLLFRIMFSNLEELKFEGYDCGGFCSCCPDGPKRFRGVLRKYFQLFPQLKWVIWVGDLEECGSGARKEDVLLRPKSLPNL